ncbi:hypothetical protein N7493_005056 [Penicillium malachiteum]|uniref:Uncharacterized protein n=1 Tax=Penicillium malachiteum TaxID=1324776 RepID=A0AAD6HLZ3_9EURO|nr:hypothetical protein N7493_005056 [Penicillium malachiteum]
MAFDLGTASVHASRGLEEPSHDVLPELLLAVLAIGLLLEISMQLSSQTLNPPAKGHYSSENSSEV